MPEREVPKNIVQSVSHTVSVGGLSVLIEKLSGDANVIDFVLVPAGANMQVTVRFAVMDLALHRAAIAYEIEGAVKAANGR